MFTYSFLNNTGAPVSIKNKDTDVLVPFKSSYVIKVGELCPILYKVELHKTKKVYTLASDFILNMRRIHNMLRTVAYEWEVSTPNEVTVEEPKRSKSESVSTQAPKEVEEVSVVEEKSEPAATEDLITFKIIEFNPVMYVGKPEKILVKVDGDGRSISFKSSNKDIATVTRFGNVYPQAPGNTEITVTFNGVSKVLKLEVLPAEDDNPEEE